MLSKLKNLITVVAIVFASLSAHADDTLNSLHDLSNQIRGTVQELSSPNLTNVQRLDSIKKQKERFELDLKQIIQREQRDPSNEDIHDRAYEKIDDLMIGMAALSVLKLNTDMSTIQEESSINAKGLLKLFSDDESMKTVSSPHEPFLKLIEMMVKNTRAI